MNDTEFSEAIIDIRGQLKKVSALLYRSIVLLKVYKSPEAIQVLRQAIDDLTKLTDNNNKGE